MRSQQTARVGEDLAIVCGRGFTPPLRWAQSGSHTSPREKCPRDLSGGWWNATVSTVRQSCLVDRRLKLGLGALWRTLKAWDMAEFSVRPCHANTVDKHNIGWPFPHTFFSDLPHLHLVWPSIRKFSFQGASEYGLLQSYRFNAITDYDQSRKQWIKWYHRFYMSMLIVLMSHSWQVNRLSVFVESTPPYNLDNLE